MVIPESRHDPRRYWENLSSHVLVRRMIGIKEQLFFVEPVRDGWFYPCTIDDLETVLRHCSAGALESFDFIVLRQPTRKQKMLRPVWGRAVFNADIGGRSGSAIILEAQSLGSYTWKKSITPEDAAELERLRADGHAIRATRRGFEISPTATSIRATVLFRTLLHEIGHHVDRRRSAATEWDQKTSAAKEDAAHRYAQEARSALAEMGCIPFDVIINEASLERDGVKREWFDADASRRSAQRDDTSAIPVD